MHNSLEEVVTDIRETNDLLKEELKQGWAFWIGMVVVGAVVWTTDQIGLLRGIFVMAALGFYFAYKWHAELNRRLLLSNRLLLTLIKRALPEEADRHY